MNSITLGRIVLDGSYSTGLRSALPDARLASGLKEIGVSARLYSGKPEGRVIEVVRQLVRMRTDAYLFWISPEVSVSTYKLARGVLDLRSDAHMLFWTDSRLEPLPNRAELETVGSMFVARSPEEMLALLLRSAIAREGIDLAKIRFSPYRSGLLGAPDVSRYGLSTEQPLDFLRDEVLWLAAQPLSAETIVPISAVHATEATLLELCQMLAEANLPADIELHATAQSVTQAVLDAMSLARIERLVIEDLTALSFKPVEYGVKLVNSGNSPQELLNQRVRYGRNGIVAQHAGIYPDISQSPAVQHLEVPLTSDPEHRQRAYKWAAPNMAMRSAVVLQGSLKSVVEHLPRLQTPATEETSGWPKHSYAIGFEQDSQQAQVFFDGLAETKQKVQYVPLSELDRAPNLPGTMTFVTMHSANDLAELERQLEIFHREGVVRIKHPSRSIVFENTCRWVGFGACRLLSLRRLQIVEDNKLLTCRDSGEAGHVGDPFDGIVNNLKQRRQIEEVRRECATCIVRDQCSQCINLPAAWGGRYCEVRRSFPQTPLFFALIALPQILTQHIQIKAEEIEMRISYAGLPPQHFQGAPGEARQGQRPVIASVLGQNLAWWPGTRKLIRLSAPLTLMAEAWWSGAIEADITRELSRTFNVDISTAASSLAEGQGKLATEGLIHA